MKIIETKNVKNLILPIFDVNIPAGFPNPIDDYLVAEEIDLKIYLNANSCHTFFVRVTGNSMINAGIREGSLLIVDKSIEPTHNKIVIAIINNEFTVKRLVINNGIYYLVPENAEYSAIEVNQHSYIWGVVTSIINKV